MWASKHRGRLCLLGSCIQFWLLSLCINLCNWNVNWKWVNLVWLVLLLESWWYCRSLFFKLKSGFCDTNLFLFARQLFWNTLAFGGPEKLDFVHHSTINNNQLLNWIQRPYLLQVLLLCCTREFRYRNLVVLFCMSECFDLKRFTNLTLSCKLY